MKPIWNPSPERIERATLTRYQAWLADTRDLRFDDYEQLWRWSVDELEAFWRSIVGVLRGALRRAAHGGPRVVARCRARSGSPGAALNYAEHVFRGKADEAVALRHASELRELGEWTWGGLRARDSRDRGWPAGPRGRDPGDRVAAYMPNIPETVAAFLACASIGAIWSSAAPDFGARSVIDRFSQIEPKVLLAVDGYRYGGRDFDRSSAGRARSPSVPGCAGS